MYSIQSCHVPLSSGQLAKYTVTVYPQAIGFQGVVAIAAFNRWHCKIRLLHTRCSGDPMLTNTRPHHTRWYIESGHSPSERGGGGGGGGGGCNILLIPTLFDHLLGSLLILVRRFRLNLLTY